MHPACAKPVMSSPVSNRPDRILIFIRTPSVCLVPLRALAQLTREKACGLAPIYEATQDLATLLALRSCNLGPQNVAPVEARLEHNSQHEVVQRLPTGKRLMSAAELDA